MKKQEFYGARKKVLVIETDRATSRWLSIMLAQANRDWDIKSHDNWSQAVASAADAKQDVVVLGIDGKTQMAAVGVFIERVKRMCPEAEIVLHVPSNRKIQHELAHATVSKQNRIEPLAMAISSAIERTRNA